ncbi:GAF domain-containing protein [Galbitalea soli]|uniref:GAF domain-containing protein n=1 Tax=Galbitalea soli TaxID=1268042 RepID=A0A7C9PL97_9MICO|nr:GAF domain-containing protein [Galbitalea soli]
MTPSDASSLSFPDPPRAELDRALGDLVTIAEQVLTTQGRLRALLRANEAVVQQLDLPVVLRTIVEAAVELVDAKFGALGVIDSQGGLEQFIHVGLSAEEAAPIGHLPQGHGILGAVIDDPRPIRLAHLTRDPRSVGFPAEHPAMQSFLGVPITVREEVYGNLYLTDSARGEFSDADEELVTALAATAGFAIDNARLFAETKRRQAWSAASAEVTEALLAADESNALEIVATRTLALAGADLVLVVETAAEPGRLRVTIARGAGEKHFEGTTFAAADSVSESVMVARQPRLLHETDSPPTLGEHAAEYGPMMALPLMARGGALGALLVVRSAGGPRFSRADLELAADFAEQASVAMELAQARADRQRMMLLEDRGRIARDLHDHVIQQLFATGMELQSTLGTLPIGPAMERVDRSITNIDAAISQIRTAIFALSSEQNQRGDTVRHRIIDVVNEIADAFPRPPHLDFSGAIDSAIDDAVADDLLAVIRESLTNAARHSHPTVVSVSVSVDAGMVMVRVTNDGAPEEVSGRRSGIANLAARAEQRGGSFDFEIDGGVATASWVAHYRSESSEVRV